MLYSFQKKYLRKITILKEKRKLFKYVICGFIKYLHIKNNNKKLVVLVSNNILIKVANI